jgi:hypothetical protein
MTSHELVEFNSTDLDGLFGPPPVLRTENLENFEKLFGQVMACIMPRDVIESILVRNFVYASWQIDRYSRHQIACIERRHRQNVEFQVQRAKAQKMRKEALAKDLTQRALSNPADVAKLVHLEELVEMTSKDVDDILERTPTELEHNRALENSITFIEQLDVLLTRATARRNDALKLLEHYRKDLGQLLRKVTHEILDAEYEEVEAHPQHTEVPPLVTSDEVTRGLAT